MYTHNSAHSSHNRNSTKTL